MSSDKPIEEQKEPQKITKPAPEAKEHRVYRGEDGYDTRTDLF